MDGQTLNSGVDEYFSSVRNLHFGGGRVRIVRKPTGQFGRSPGIARAKRICSSAGGPSGFGNEVGRNTRIALGPCSIQTRQRFSDRRGRYLL